MVLKDVINDKKIWKDIKRPLDHKNFYDKEHNCVLVLFKDFVYDAKVLRVIYISTISRYIEEEGKMSVYSSRSSVYNIDKKGVPDKYMNAEVVALSEFTEF